MLGGDPLKIQKRAVRGYPQNCSFAQATGRIFRCSIVVDPHLSPVTPEPKFFTIIIKHSLPKCNGCEAKERFIFQLPAFAGG
jgi:hypothetical protein